MDWQQLAALTIVALAAIWLVRTQILAPRRGGCSGCGHAAPPSLGRDGAPLIQIDLEPPASRRE
jgi:hypothetical protein